MNNQNIILSLTIFLLSITNSISSFGQNSDFFYKHYKKEDGLRHNSVKTIFKDSYGYMWFGTIDGLSRFDGNKFTNFKDAENSNKRFINTYINAIAEDKYKTLWVGSNNGLYQYSHSNNIFKIFSLNKANSNSTPNYSRINCLQPHKESMWIGTSGGLIKLNLGSKKIEQVQYKNDSLNSEETIEIRSILLSKGKLWIGTSKGLYLYDIKSKSPVTDKKFEAEIQSALINKKINHLRVDNLGIIWVSTEDGIISILEKEEKYKLQTYRIATNDNKKEAKDFYFTFTVQNNSVYAGSFKAGLYKLDKNTNSFIKSDNFRFPNHTNSLRTYYLDRHNNTIWFGDLNFGLYQFNINPKTFKAPPKSEILNNYAQFFSFEEDAENSHIMWCGTSEGLLRLNRKTGRLTVYYINFEKKINFTIKSIKDNKKGTLYIGTHNEGLFIFDKTSGEFRQHTISKKYPRQTQINCLIFDNEKLYATADNYLFIYDEISHQLKKITVNSNKTHKLYSMKKVGNKLLLGSSSQKIKIFNLNTQKLSSILIEDKKDLKNADIILGFFKIGHDILFSTYGNGIFKLDIALKKISRSLDLSSFEGQTAYSIIEGKNKELWVTTNHGLIRYFQNRSSHITYDESDGLNNYEFNIGAYYKAADGEIFIGGRNGYNSFYSDSIKIQQRTLPLYLDKLAIMGNPIVPGSRINGKILNHKISFGDTIRLAHGDNNISVIYTAIEYNQKSKIRYRYKLEGFDNDWVYKSNRNNHAEFTNLDPGEYTLIIQAESKYSNFQDNEKRLYINITPAFWSRPVFYFVLVILIVFLTTLFIKVREKKLKIEQKKLEQIIDLRTSEIVASKRRLEIEKGFSDAIINNSTEGIAVLDKNLSLINHNPALLQISGYKHIEIAQSNIMDIIPEEWSMQLKRDFEQLKKTGAVISEIELVRADKSLVDVRISSALITESNIVSVITDISKRKIAEFKAEQYRADLEKQVRERTADYKKAKEEAENADHLKTAFLANMSHEIRTPLNSILGFAQLLNDDDITIEQTKNYTDLIRRGGNSLLHLINDIIDLAKIESNQLPIEKEDFSVNEIITDSFDLFLNSKENIENGKINIVLNIPEKDVVLHSDPNRITQLLINLLNNAHKFTEQGTIEVGYRHTIEKGNVYLEFFVSDTGSGIPTDKQDKIFSRFTKFDKNSTHVIKGAGLGLAISKRITELLGGRIYLKSELGDGSTFFFTIPV